jgi:hypothetical protein
MVDYFLCNRVYLQVHQLLQQQTNITDHDLLYTRLPLLAANVAPPTAAADRSTPPPLP